MLRVRAIASASDATDGDALIESGGGGAGVGEKEGSKRFPGVRVDDDDDVGIAPAPLEEEEEDCVAAMAAILSFATLSGSAASCCSFCLWAETRTGALLATLF